MSESNKKLELSFLQSLGFTLEQLAAAEKGVHAVVWVPLKLVQAKELLDAPIPNQRPCGKNHVKNLTTLIQRGKFILNGSAIKINQNWQVMDGKHRLTAIVAAGVEDVMIAIEIGFNPNDLYAMDVASKLRSDSDVLATLRAGYTGSYRDIAKAGSWLVRLKRGDRSLTIQAGSENVPVSHDERVELIDTLPRVRELVEVVKDIDKDATGIGTPPKLAAFITNIEFKNADKSAEFLQFILNPQEAAKNCPTVWNALQTLTATRNAKIKGKAAGRKNWMYFETAVLTVAWNAFVMGNQNLGMDAYKNLAPVGKKGLTPLPIIGGIDGFASTAKPVSE